MEASFLLECTTVSSRRQPRNYLPLRPPLRQRLVLEFQLDLPSFNKTSLFTTTNFRSTEHYEATAGLVGCEDAVVQTRT